MRDFISLKDLTKKEILEVLETAEKLENIKDELLDKKIVASLFFEPSTRTRLSFTSAAYRLGAKVLGFESPEMTSLKKGESLRDTIKMTESYSDIIVMRHPLDGAARFAADISKIPVINAGDGSNEHPSQTLLDLYTIKKEFGEIENKKIAFIGDLKYGRTVHSLVKALNNFKCEYYFIAPDLIQIPEYILKELDEIGVKYKLESNYQDILKEIDILYMTRIQRERFDDEKEYEKVKGVYKLNKENIDKRCKENMIILHPLPRVDEIDIDLDETKYAKYFIQAKNGVPTREAMYMLALNKETRDKKIEYKINKEIICENKKCITKFERTENKYIEKNNKKYCYYCNKEIKK